MSNKATSQQKLLPHLFREEYTKMTAVLCHHFGLKHIEIAEDIVSETFLKATETWDIQGIPENPTAWLYIVAKNKAKDYLKRHAIFETQVKGVINVDERQFESDFDFTQQAIDDSQLAMIFAICNPSNSVASQICLALQILCGFSVAEIANAFLTKPETIKKRLLRARKNLRRDNFQIRFLVKKTIQSRLDIVLKTLYLLFNEGYFSASNDHLIRKDLCSEAIRLMLVLIENPFTNTPEANALMALMCFQSSRLEARSDEKGETILYEQQDKDRWSKELIEKGNYYLINAFSGSVHWQTKYHLEAAIAYWHTTSINGSKWEHILQLYNQLILIEYSPITALNRTFAFAKVYGNEQAIKEAEKLNLNHINHYHALLGYLYADTDVSKSIAHYGQAISLTTSTSEKKALGKEIERLNKI